MKISNAVSGLPAAIIWSARFFVTSSEGQTSNPVTIPLRVDGGQLFALNVATTCLSQWNHVIQSL